jgi:hypothetical protein
MSLEQQPIQLFFKAQYNLKQELGSDKWNRTAGFTIIVKYVVKQIRLRATA